MMDLFGLRRLAVTREQLDRIPAADLGPVAKQILLNSKIPRVADLASPDPGKAAAARRELAREYFGVD